MLWELNASQPLKTLIGKEGSSQIVFAPGGRRLASKGTGGRNVTVWDTTVDPPKSHTFDSTSEITSIALSRDGSKLAIGSRNSGIELSRTEPPQVIAQIPTQNGIVADLLFSKDGKTIVSRYEAKSNTDPSTIMKTETIASLWFMLRFCSSRAAATRFMWA